MAKGGSKEQSVTLPKFYETALQQQIGMAGDVSQTGYVPYYGPEVAAFSPMQEAAMQGTDMMAGVPWDANDRWSAVHATSGNVCRWCSRLFISTHLSASG